MSCGKLKLGNCRKCVEANKSGREHPPGLRMPCRKLSNTKRTSYNRPIRPNNHKLYKEPSRLAYVDASGKVEQLFPIKIGTKLYDGQANERGTLTSLKRKLNYGQIKTLIINGEAVPCVYALDVMYKDTGGQSKRASSWIRLDAMNFDLAINPSAFPAATPEEKKNATAQKTEFDKMLNPNLKINRYIKPRPTPLTKFAKNFEVYKITGGDPALHKKLGNSKINPCIHPDESKKAMDYFQRPGDTNSPNGYVNLLYSTPGLLKTAGGFSTDTLPVHIEPEKDPNGMVVTNEDGTVKNPGRESFFYRYIRNDIKPVTIPLYEPCSTKRHKNPKSLTFVYGFVGDPDDTKKNDRRYGWIAEDAIERL